MPHSIGPASASLLVLACCATGAGCANAPVPTGSERSAPQSLVVANWSESFNSNNASWLEASWSNSGDPSFDATFSPNAISFPGSHMELTVGDVIPNAEDAPGMNYTGAQYQTVDTFLHGRFDMRMRGTSTLGVVSSFFLRSETGSGEEIDIEFRGADGVQTNYYQGGVQHPCLYTPPMGVVLDPAADYHIYSIERTATTITWYVDGHQMRTETPATPLVDEMKVMLNIWVTDPTYWNVGSYPNMGPVVAYYDTLQYTYAP